MLRGGGISFSKPENDTRLERSTRHHLCQMAAFPRRMAPDGGTHTVVALILLMCSVCSSVTQALDKKGDAADSHGDGLKAAVQSPAPRSDQEVAAIEGGRACGATACC